MKTILILLLILVINVQSRDQELVGVEYLEVFGGFMKYMRVFDNYDHFVKCMGRYNLNNFVLDDKFQPRFIKKGFFSAKFEKIALVVTSDRIFDQLRYMSMNCQDAFDRLKKLGYEIFEKNKVEYVQDGFKHLARLLLNYRLAQDSQKDMDYYVSGQFYGKMINDYVLMKQSNDITARKDEGIYKQQINNTNYQQQFEDIKLQVEQSVNITTDHEINVNDEIYKWVSFNKFIGEYLYEIMVRNNVIINSDVCQKDTKYIQELLKKFSDGTIKPEQEYGIILYSRNLVSLIIEECMHVSGDIAKKLYKYQKMISNLNVLSFIYRMSNESEKLVKLFRGMNDIIDAYNGMKERNYFRYTKLKEQLTEYVDIVWMIVERSLEYSQRD